MENALAQVEEEEFNAAFAQNHQNQQKRLRPLTAQIRGGIDRAEEIEVASVKPGISLLRNLSKDAKGARPFSAAVY